ncbi:hypothetical protein AVEN_162414-1 [Araneus ventricosus]|uniref:Uncharacterized protein n=1 Tax=Araneus ventricosus TaxID=182803 RepID=A0A4Y2JKT2_ARAVE|nr:hypothetical protein AVEN_162414-1 [Araneus ventricosus]
MVRIPSGLKSERKIRGTLEEAGEKNNALRRLKPRFELLVFLLLACTWTAAAGQLNRLKVPRHRVGSSKFSLNPLKPLMNLMRQDPMKASATRHHVKYLPPPPSMYQHMALPSRTSSVTYGMHPYRPYPSQHVRMLPPSTVSLLPQYMASPSSHMYSTLYNDHQAYRPMPSDMQVKAVRIPTKVRKPAASMDSLNIADSVVRQLLDMSSQKQQSENTNNPSVLVIEDPDVTSSSQQSEIFGDTLAQSPQKIMLAPPVHAEYAQDSSADVSSNSANNPEVFVIVSKNKGKNNYYIDEKKQDLLSSPSSSSKLKKFKITSAYDENGDRQVWIIK